jgi:hypothetical protein
MQNKQKRKENFLYSNLKENEIVRPSLYLLYWIVLSICLIAIICSFVQPVSGAYYDNPTYTINSTPPTYVGNVGDTFGRVYLKSSAVGSSWVCMVSNSTNSQGNKIDGEDQGCHAQYNYVAGPQTVTAVRHSNWVQSKFFVYYIATAPFPIVSSTSQSWTSPVGVNSSYGNITFNVKNAASLANIPAVSVNYVYDPNHAEVAQTDANGNVTLSFLTTNATANPYYITKEGYVSQTGTFALTDPNMFKQIYLSQSTASEYYITVSPAWIPSDGSQYLYGQIRKQYTGEDNLTDIKEFGWTWHKMGLNGIPNGPETSYNDVTFPSGILAFSKASSGIYGGWVSTGYTNTKTARLPNPLSLNPIGATGSILTSLRMTDIYGNSYLFNVSNLIGDNTTTNTLKIRIQDAYTGGALTGAGISIRDESTGSWQNTSTPSGEYYYTVASGKQLTLVSTASGYQTLTRLITVEANNPTTYQNMYISGYAGSTGKTQLVIYTRSSPTSGYSSLPLKDVYVSVKQVNESIVKSDYSGDAGNVILSANVSTVYQITGSKTGYLSSTQTINTGAINPYEVYLFLTNANVYSPTLTPTPYPTVTPTIVSTPISWASGSASTCNGTYNPSSILDYLKKQAACNGFETAMSQSLLLAAIIILLCTGFGAKYGKAIGAAIGAILGFVLAFALGVIPFMVLALVLVLLVLFAMIILGLKNG